ncbi:uncharacterized protein PRCAT00001103001 [Priceomyces carsonii]|uniref:uncharacterized protein n=1 Tax=Priceomyces carsonii TaxID=28549 RepID=UPI002EDA8A25|nr:unnamed protein product [Priceomyces carsonii]
MDQVDESRADKVQDSASLSGNVNEPDRTSNTEHKPVNNNLSLTPKTEPNQEITLTKKHKIEDTNTEVMPPLTEVVGGSSLRRYLNEHLTLHILEGLRELSRDKPKDPLFHLGQFLINRSQEQKNQREEEI